MEVERTRRRDDQRHYGMMKKSVVDIAEKTRESKGDPANHYSVEFFFFCLQTSQHSITQYTQAL
jgi:hypothetical protein